MAKYEVAIFIKTDIEKNIPEIQLLEKCSNFSITEMGIHDLAYDIKGQKKAKFLVLNFDNSDTSLLNEFRRRISLNENVLRHLIINLDNDYGAKSLKNSKKVKLSQQKQKKYNEWVSFKQSESANVKAAETISMNQPDDIVFNEVENISELETEFLLDDVKESFLDKDKIKK